MIPRIIHYCWFGGGEIPQLAKDCISSWHKFMPDWKFNLWNEDNFDINSVPYVKEAYDARKYAFVSDYVRLYALMTQGGLYMDVDFEVFKSFDGLRNFPAFAGYEGSKRSPIMMGVIASEPDGEWVKDMIGHYENRHFILADGTLDLTPNVTFLTQKMIADGLICNGKEQDFKGLHIFPVEYFCPRQTTGEYIRTDNTFCDHKGLNSWSARKKPLLLKLAGPKLSISLIKIKRAIFK